MIRAMATPLSLTMVAVQGVSVAMAGGVSALITMSLNTINTRMPVLDREENGEAGSHRWAEIEESSQGTRMDSLLPRVRAEVGFNVDVCNHYDYYLRVPEEAVSEESRRSELTNQSSSVSNKNHSVSAQLLSINFSFADVLVAREWVVWDYIRFVQVFLPFSFLVGICRVMADFPSILRYTTS